MNFSARPRNLSSERSCPITHNTETNMKTQCTVAIVLIGLAVGCAHSQKATPNLSTPESTIIGFTKAAAEGHAKLAQSYFLPGGIDYQDVWETLTAKPGTPRYSGRVMMEAVDPSRPMTVKSKKETEHGLKVVWQVTFRRGFEVDGKKVEAGTQYDLDATLKKTEKGWLIDNF
jgi:hypothetical protein